MDKTGVWTSYLWQVGSVTLQLASHDKYRLQSSQSKVVVVLFRQLLTSQLVQYSHLLGQNLQKSHIA